MAYRDVRKVHCDDRGECIRDGSELGDLWSSSKQVVHDLKEILAIDVSGDDAQRIDIGTCEVNEAKGRVLDVVIYQRVDIALRGRVSQCVVSLSPDPWTPNR